MPYNDALNHLIGTEPDDFSCPTANSAISLRQIHPDIVVVDERGDAYESLEYSSFQRHLAKHCVVL
jgi:hypothetical protein